MADHLSAEDRTLIIELMSRYAWAIDTGDVEGYVSCFTPNAVLTMRGVAHTGQDAIRTYITAVVNRPDFPGRQHHHNEHVFDGDSERCAVKSYSTISQRFPDGDTRIVFAGWYRDVCVRTEQGWRFESRTWDTWDGTKLEVYRRW